MINATPREAAFLVCLSESYELAGRKLSDTTILSAAKDMAARIPCSDNEIKELFLKAREYNDIPTTRTLWRAWDFINENRPPVPALTYDNSTRFLRAINYRQTLNIFAAKIGRYMDLCRAYLTIEIGKGKYEWKNPGLKNQFDSEVIPMMEKVCGKWLGENPNDPHHPVQRFKGFDYDK